jgi:hypothetical protein
MKRLWMLAVLISAVLASGGWLCHRWIYPYGWSHCCDKQLMLALMNYSDVHGHAYPTGEATPEASLSLLYPNYADAELLRGKTVPVDVVNAVLESGNRLGPDTCGWHYVDGLTSHDDPKLALFWDKVGLGHNGERLPDGGRTVYFVNLNHEYIAGAVWEVFLEEQKALLANRKKTKH